jgi:hypothetical protein
MAQFKSWDSYAQFSREIASHRRYVRTQETEEFLRTVSSTCEARRRSVPKNTIFWRAQLGHDSREVEGSDYQYPEDVAFGPLRMQPRRERATEGRANPKGIPCLYVSTTARAAMSEVRPWVGAYVSLAQFEVTRELTIVNCSVLHDQYFNLAFRNRTFDAQTATMSTPSPDEVEEIVWAAIDGTFSNPVAQTDDVADYAPTQVLAELFRSEGYDGVAYKNAFGSDGYSIALFELDSAVQLNGMLHKVESVEYKFSKDPCDQYFIKDGRVLRNVIVSIEPIPRKR